MAKIEVELANGAKAGSSLQELTKEANKLNKEISKLPIGSDDFIQKSKQLQQVSGNVTDVRNQIKGTTQASDALKNSFGGVLNQIPGFGPLSGMLNQAKGGVGGLTSGFGLLRGAIAATGIGALVLIVMALISAFSKFTPVIDKVEQILSGLSAVISEITQRIQNFGAGLWDIITGTPGGVDKLKSSFDGLADSIGAAYDAGVQLKKLQQDLEDLNRGIAITNAEHETQIDRLILQSKNRSLSLKEQNDLLRQAKTIAEENFKSNDELDKKNLEALIKEAQLSSKLTEQEILQLAQGTLAQEVEYSKRGTISDELLQKLTDAQVKVIEAEGKTNNLKEKIANREAAIREKQEADLDKALDAELKRKEKLAKAEEDRLKKEVDAKKNIEDLKIQLIDDAMTREIEQVQLSTERKMEALVGTEDQIREQKSILKILELETIAEIEDRYALAAAEKDKKNKDDQAKRDKEQADEKKRMAEEIAQFESDIKDLRISTEREATLGIGELVSSQIKNAKAAKAARKILSIAELGFNLQQELASNAAGGAKIAASYPPVSIPLGAAYTAGANLRSLLRTGIGLAKILTLRKGGILRGPSHERGGIPLYGRGGQIYGEAEGDEIVLTKGVYRNPVLRRAASVINVLGGGRKFESGGPITSIGVTSSRPAPPISLGASDGSAQTQQGEEMKALLKANFDAINNRFDRIKVVNVVSETEDGIKTLNSIKNDADV